MPTYRHTCPTPSTGAPASVRFPSSNPPATSCCVGPCSLQPLAMRTCVRIAGSFCVETLLEELGVAWIKVGACGGVRGCASDLNAPGYFVLWVHPQDVRDTGKEEVSEQHSP